MLQINENTLVPPTNVAFSLASSKVYALFAAGKEETWFSSLQEAEQARLKAITTESFDLREESLRATDRAEELMVLMLDQFSDNVKKFDGDGPITKFVSELVDKMGSGSVRGYNEAGGSAKSEADQFVDDMRKSFGGDPFSEQG